MTSLPPDLSDRTLQIQPLARAETIPSSWYVDPAFHGYDRDHIMGRSWQYMGPASRVESPGSYVSDVVAGEPVLVVRDSDGVLKAYFNVCRHRGGPLVTEPCGHTRMLQCKYHGWTYKLDGSLRGVPRFDRSELFDKRDFGLTSLSVCTWEGMLFVNLSSEPEPIESAVSGIAERIAPLDMSAMRFERRDTYAVDCNWKVYVDNYLEGYHLPIVHPELCDLLDYRSYVTETYPGYSLQFSPLQDGDNIYGGSGEAFYYFVFPNLMLNILPHRLQVNKVVATAHDKTLVIFDYYYQEGTPPSLIQDDAEFSDRVQMEDVEICEHVQVGLGSRAYDRGRFSPDAEPGVYHFQCMLKDAYRAARGRDATHNR